MNIVAVIPARGGSKRLPRKNIKILDNLPLISWTINVAKEVTGLSKIIVSTDDQEIANIAEESGVIVPWLRPKNLASDNSTIIDVLIHCLDWLNTSDKMPDAIVVLQPTSPFRRATTIERAIDIFKRGDGSSVIGVSDSGHFHPHWSFTLDGNSIIPSNLEGIKQRSQDLPKSFFVNGYIYIVKTDTIFNQKTLFTKKCLPIEIPQEESIDIDTEWDWNLAEFHLSKQKK